MATFNAADIVGKTLIAQEAVKAKLRPIDTEPNAYNIAAGQPVGTVYSWISPSPQNKRLYWMFKDANGKSYFVEHNEGRFSISNLKAQGVLTTEEKTAQEQAAAQPLTTTLTNSVTKLAYIAAAAYILAAVLPNLFKKK